MRTRKFLALAGIALLLSACTPAPSPSPSGAATQSTVPSPSPTPSATSSPTAQPSDDEFTDETLASLCIEKTRGYFDSDVEFFPDEVRIEARKVDPPWLVIVPAYSLGDDGFAVCTIGGSATEPVFEAQSAVSDFTEAEIEDAINGVEYYEGE